MVNKSKVLARLKTCIFVACVLIFMDLSAATRVHKGISTTGLWNKTFFIQKHKTQINIQKNFLSLNANLISYSAFLGKGTLCIQSPEKDVSIDVFNNSISNMLVKRGARLYLYSHLRIKHSLLIQESGRIVLGDFNLNLSGVSHINRDFEHRIVLSGKGIIIFPQFHRIEKTFLSYHTFITPLYNEEAIYALHQTVFPYGNRPVACRNLQTYIDINTPPPKF